MNIELVSASKIKAFEKNAKIHDETQVNNVKESIRQFGMIQPLVVDKNNVLIIGHCRFKACKALGMKEVPCVKAENLTQEQVDKLRLLDNKLNESEWDFDLLADSLEDIDMSEFDIDWGFEYEDEFDTGYYGDERERTYNSVNLKDFDPDRASNFYDIPLLEPCNHIPSGLIGFNYAKTSKEYDKGIHFFIDDYQFERIWNEPEINIERLKNFDCVLTPDFSLYMDMPMAMKIWNVYRSRLIGQACQDVGLNVIPTLSWAEPETYDFCFETIPKHATVAVSTVGCMRDKQAKSIWLDGMSKAIEITEPKTILCYGSKIDYDFEGVDVKWFNAREFKKEE